MTTTAICGGFRVCQSFLGAKIHDAKDPGSDLSAMLTQVVGSVFRLMDTHTGVWMPVQGSRDVPVFGFRFDVGLEPIQVNLERMIQHFRRGLEDLGEVWEVALQPDAARELRSLGTLVQRTFICPTNCG